MADIKTFEQHQVYGFAINTANTIQTENEFVAIQWTELSFVLQSIETLFEAYEIKAVKIGIIPSLDYLKSIVFLIKILSPKTKIVWDTVLKSTTEFDFLNIQNQEDLISILNQIDLITPNYNEILKLIPTEKKVEISIEMLSKYCAVLLKGGHHPTEIGTDFLHMQNQFFRLSPNNTKVYPKHGSGCVLSAAITANLALKQNLLHACKNAKSYTENFLLSNPTQLGNHYV
ncbi:bifunctional hydroxymethylpyrimidine kinase/phosphomethylpyrimidine kinase [Flavobacterium palustre]|uniref:bifunctional hydroxymethylpyrimidine kinase/phosphomethylpyrimidine kinase n=1 Tax=Flavobacterium palustre TaxID=1476463 RepID=UPI003608F3B8